MKKLSDIDINRLKAQLEACYRTRELHQQVVDGVYSDYKDAKFAENTICRLCVTAESFPGGGVCRHCPWVWFTGNYCEFDVYMNSAESIVRLTNWIRWIRDELQQRKEPENEPTS